HWSAECATRTASSPLHRRQLTYFRRHLCCLRFSTKLKCFAYNVSGFASEPHIYCFIQGILLDVNCHPLPPGRPGCAPKLVRFPKCRTCMRVYPVCELTAHRSVRNSFRQLARMSALITILITIGAFLLPGSAQAHVNLVSYHYDNARTG